MGSSDISGIGKIFAVNQSAGNGVGAVEEDAKIAFQEVMSQMAGMVANGMQTGANHEDAGKKTAVENASVGRDYGSCHHREIEKQSAKAGLKEKNQVTEKMESFAKDVKEVLKEELGVSEEQIEEAMATLGLSFADLMNPNQLAALVMELTGTESANALLCNSEFLSIMQAVNGLGEELLNEFGITMEELTQLFAMEQNSVVQEAGVAQEESVEANAGVADVFETSAESDALTESEISAESNALTEASGDGIQKVVSAAENTAEQTLEGTEQPEGMDAQDAKVSEELLDAKNVPEEASDQQIADEAEEELAKTVTAVESEETKSGNDSTFGNQHSQTMHSGSVVVNHSAAEAAATQPTEGMNGFSSQLDVADIIRQIVEYSKVTVGNQATTMEMQLNPENLGKVYLEITSKNGVVSAHITAQDEVVKEALESQLVALRQNMNESGVKVDAVEVTVGSHEFERNLEQNAKREEQQAEEQEKAVKQTRRINLNDLDELAGLMTEEESLVAKMMADQGNTVDFTA